MSSFDYIVVGGSTGGPAPAAGPSEESDTRVRASSGSRAMSLLHRSHRCIFAFRSTSKNLRARLDCGVDEDFGGRSCV